MRFFLVFLSIFLFVNVNPVFANIHATVEFKQAKQLVGQADQNGIRPEDRVRFLKQAKSLLYQLAKGTQDQVDRTVIDLELIEVWKKLDKVYQLDPDYKNVYGKLAETFSRSILQKQAKGLESKSHSTIADAVREVRPATAAQEVSEAKPVTSEAAAAGSIARIAFPLEEGLKALASVPDTKTPTSLTLRDVPRTAAGTGLGAAGGGAEAGVNKEKETQFERLMQQSVGIGVGPTTTNYEKMIFNERALTLAVDSSNPSWKERAGKVNIEKVEEEWQGDLDDYFEIRLQNALVKGNFRELISNYIKIGKEERLPMLCRSNYANAAWRASMDPQVQDPGLKSEVVELFVDYIQYMPHSHEDLFIQEIKFLLGDGSFLNKHQKRVLLINSRLVFARDYKAKQDWNGAIRQYSKLQRHLKDWFPQDPRIMDFDKILRDLQELELATLLPVVENKSLNPNDRWEPTLDAWGLAEKFGTPEQKIKILKALGYAPKEWMFTIVQKRGYFQFALQIAEETRNILDIAWIHVALGRTYIWRDQTQPFPLPVKALDHFRIAQRYLPQDKKIQEETQKIQRSFGVQ